MLKKRFIFALLAASLLSHSAHAVEDCADTTIDETKLGKLRNQGDIGTCYAYSTADLITYCMNENQAIQPHAKTGEMPLANRVSANDVAFNYVDQFSRYRIDEVSTYLGAFEEAGGDPRQAIMAVQKKGGACMENIMTSDWQSYNQARMERGEKPLVYGEWKSTRQLFQKIAGFKMAYDKFGVLACKDDAFNFVNQGEALKNSCDLQKETRFGELSKTDFGKQFFANDTFTEILRTTTQRNFFNTLDDKICGGPKDMTLKKDRKNHRRAFPASCGGEPVELVARNENTAPLITAIDDQLTAKKPIGIGVYSTFLSSNDDAALKSRQDGHGMVVTGRKKGTDGVCRYRVRNSWGPSCKKRYINTNDPYGDKYGKFVECDENEGGYFYVKRDVLAQVLSFVYYLTPAK